MADNNWDTKTLQLYKQNPCVKRYAAEAHYAADELIGLEINIKMDMKDFSEVQRNLLQYGLAGFLKISPDEIKIEKVMRGSVIVHLNIPKFCKTIIDSELSNKLENLSNYIYPLKINSIRVLPEKLPVLAQSSLMSEADSEIMDERKRRRYIQEANSWLNEYVSKVLPMQKIPFPGANIPNRYLPVITQMWFEIGKIFLGQYSEKEAAAMANSTLTQYQGEILRSSYRNLFRWIPAMGTFGREIYPDKALFNQIGAEIIEKFDQNNKRILSARAVDAQKLLSENENYTIHKLKAKDTTGRWAWYIIRVKMEMEEQFLNSISGNGDIDLEDFGEVVASGYGDRIPSEIEDNFISGEGKN